MATLLNNLSPCSLRAYGCSSGQFKFLLLEDMIVPQGKKGLSYSLKYSNLPFKYANFGKKFRVQDLLVEHVMNHHLA